MTLDEPRRIAHAAKILLELLARDAREITGIGDLVAIQMQDRQHRAVAHGVQELVAVPARGQRSRLGLAVADDRRDDEIRIVEGRAEGVRQHVAELAAFVDRARRLRRSVTRNAAGEAELLEETSHALRVLCHRMVVVRVRAFEVGVGDDRRPPVSGTRHEDHVEVARHDRAIEVRVHEVEPGRRAPVAQQPRLDVLDAQRLAQQWIVEQVDLADGKVVGRTPVGVDACELLRGKRSARRCALALHAAMVTPKCVRACRSTSPERASVGADTAPTRWPRSAARGSRRRRAPWPTNAGGSRTRR